MRMPLPARGRSRGPGHRQSPALGPTEVLRVLLAEEARGRDEATKAARGKTAGRPVGKTFDSWREADSSIHPRPRRPWSPWNGCTGPRT